MPAWSVLGKAGAATAHVKLRPGERIKAEPDALITMSSSIDLGAKMDAGILTGLMRSTFAGESLFSQTLSAVSAEGDCVLGAPEVGDVEIMRLVEPLTLAKGAFLAADDGVEIAATTQRGVGNVLLSGAGLFVLRASGQGTLAVCAHGSILSFTLREGEVRAVDNGHLVAWSERMPFEMRMAGASRGASLFGAAFSSAASGEGLMCFFTGPGQLWLQTHKPPPLPADGHREGRRRGGGGGGGGSVVGCCVGCLLLVLLLGAAAAAFVLVPAYGGRWVQTAPGAYSLEWDPPPPPPRRRLASAHERREAYYEQDRRGYQEKRTYGLADEL